MTAVLKTREIVKRFEKIEGKPWGIEGSMIELGKQIGDLSSLVMSQEGFYPSKRGEDNLKYKASKEKIGDELADILFIIIRLADLYNIDLEKAHYKALENANKYLRLKGV
jgi:NTP pyrophosphatase (non-canonical NTP hydrolase)